jgi:tRNA(His) guanylyltransferase
MSDKDSLGDRMKQQYEDRTRISLPRRTYTILRLDGKAFHTFTRGFDRPYDSKIVRWMDHAALELCKSIQGCKFAYVQSDEISLLLTDFETPQTQSWFDSNLQKMVSISASIATSAFNKAKMVDDFKSAPEFSLEHDMLFFANFDSRVFTISDPVEVANYFIWRQQDAVRNSIQMLGQSLYSHRELQEKNCDQIQEMTFQKGKNWNDVSVRNKRGGFVTKVTTEPTPGVVREAWKNIECPHFDVEFLLSYYIPKMNVP